MSGGVDRIVPGTVPVAGRRFLYLECSDQKLFENAFDEMGEWIERADDQPAHGGLISENVSVRLPGGSSFFGVSFKGDVMAWLRAIRRFAANHGIRVGEIKSGSLCVEGGEIIDLSQCEVRFY